MSLLPKARGEFTEKDYWENFFKKRGTKSFDWYGEYNELCGLLHKYIKPKDNILVIGCGNSTLSSSLYDVGYRNIVNIDTSSVVIRQMQAQHKDTRPGLVFEQKDALDTKYPDSHFSCVLDKGTLDALMPDDKEETVANINKLFNEIGRVLRVGGRYICISLLQPHILKYMLNKIPIAAPEGLGWPIRVCRSQDSSTDVQNSTGPTMPVFFVICTKFKAMGNLPSIVEMSLGEEHIQRLDSEKLTTQVQELQHAALVAWQMRSKRHLPDSQNPLSLQLYLPGKDVPRYTVTVVDKTPSNKASAYKFAAFVVPQGRETEYLFANPEGHKQLLVTASAERLAIIALHRGHNFDEGIAGIRTELSPCVVQLAPPNLPPNTQIPFLTAGDDAGHREVVFEGHSDFSGDFVVEDVEVDKTKIRKLIFLSNLAVVQSEAMLRSSAPVGRRNRRKEKTSQVVEVDKGHLACEHHRLMILGLAVPPQSQGLVIGLGGGGLCSFLHHCFTECTVTAVEIDPAMLEVATKYFNMPQDSRLQVHIGDGLKFILDAVTKGDTYDAVFFDVDNKDSSLGMSCPPQSFVTDEILGAVKSILKPEGVFVLNLVCRDPGLRQSTFTSLSKIFKSSLAIPLEDEVNEVVFCSPLKEVEEMCSWLKDAALKANQMAKKARVREEVVDVTDLLLHLSIFIQTNK